MPLQTESVDAEDAIKISDEEAEASDADKKDKQVKTETKEELDSDEDATSSLKCDPTGKHSFSSILTCTYQCNYIHGVVQSNWWCCENLYTYKNVDFLFS